MKQITLIAGLILTANWAKADSVDIATITVNSTLVRRVACNSSVPYLINLSRFNIGDTLRVEVMTDHYAEKNSFITIKNIESQRVDTIKRNNYILINKDLLTKTHFFRVTYIYSYPQERKRVWDICMTTSDDKIELIYKNANDLRDYLISTTKKIKINSAILADSVKINFSAVRLKNGSILRKYLKDTLLIANSAIPKFLLFDKIEKSFIENFNSIDYYSLHNYDNIYGFIRIDPESLNNFDVNFGGYKNRINFHFTFSQNIFVLKEISYEEY